ncbi:hypothetical protein V5O48_013203 [Marasmius crinis-equi]|uniref:Uncharacterized protein n=1 Tax=Marasmius crinis-equi TaxID=585013 RepID=A0ABR3F0R8_9AGAR
MTSNSRRGKDPAKAVKGKKSDIEPTTNNPRLASPSKGTRKPKQPGLDYAMVVNTIPLDSDDNGASKPTTNIVKRRKKRVTGSVTKRVGSREQGAWGNLTTELLVEIFKYCTASRPSVMADNNNSLVIDHARLAGPPIRSDQSSRLRVILRHSSMTSEAGQSGLSSSPAVNPLRSEPAGSGL